MSVRDNGDLSQHLSLHVRHGVRMRRRARFYIVLRVTVF